ncbi:hypothetical protein [Marichromatium bheemlicum]|uniref:Uncharacterized protein n=1 Tax=Marichromatium bheemlicum TaxID=365339 RepID=A0ABX1I698_9GAMM|nr:hypothetical protein [Marichromatium bheemlicum]NKN32579.1 hypothetical protein [Marichromatium bheemlicum]
MTPGHLSVETHPDHPGLVRLRVAAQPPTPTPRLHCVVRFEDVTTARMHAHQHLRRHLVDIDSGLYRTDPLTACAAIAAIALPQRHIALDPELAADPRYTRLIDRTRIRNRRIDRLFNAVGLLALLLLLILALPVTP